MYHDILVRIKNAQAARHRTVTMPYSKLNFDVVKVLADTGYVKSVEKQSVNKKNVLEVALRYEKGEPMINGLKFMSTPSRHIYIKAGSLKQIKQGYGVGVLSTSRGVMSVKDAKKAGIGGEYLFQIW